MEEHLVITQTGSLYKVVKQSGEYFVGKVTDPRDFDRIIPECRFQGKIYLSDPHQQIHPCNFSNMQPGECISFMDLREHKLKRTSPIKIIFKRASA